EENGITPDYIELASDIVSAFVSNNSVPVSELPGLLVSVHATLAKLTSNAAEAPAEPLAPAVPVKRSVTADFIV
ncbi:MucR family transcriptional regulator, partial [Proteus mirabilis]